MLHYSKEFKIATYDEAIEKRLSVNDCPSEREKLWKAIKNNVVETYDKMKKNRDLAVQNSHKNCVDYDLMREKYCFFWGEVKAMVSTLNDGDEKNKFLRLLNEYEIFRSN